MVGILILLALSALLLYFIEKKSLLALGVFPVSKRLLQFGVCFLFTAALCTLVQFIDSYFYSLHWTINEEIRINIILKALWWDLKSVITEELVFRGAILFILIKRTGAHRAIILSAVAFGVYHWFSYGIIGNIVPMILIFLGTGLMGYTWALAFSKTKSIMLPIGLHLGWNFVYNTVFSKGPLGELILISHNGVQVTGLISTVLFLIQMIISPLIMFLFVKYLVTEEKQDRNEMTSSID